MTTTRPFLYRLRNVFAVSLNVVFALATLMFGFAVLALIRDSEYAGETIQQGIIPPLAVMVAVVVLNYLFFDTFLWNRIGRRPSAASER